MNIEEFPPGLNDDSLESVYSDNQN